MRETRNAVDDNPKVLKVVAVLFLVEGLFGAFDTTMTMTRDIESGIFPLHVNFLLIGFPICFGLLKNLNGWRMTAVVVAWLQIVIMSIILTLSILYLIGFDDRLPERLRVEPEIWLASGTVGAASIALCGLVLAVWKYRVLRRPDIRSLFKTGSPLDRDAP